MSSTSNMSDMSIGNPLGAGDLLNSKNNNHPSKSGSSSVDMNENENESDRTSALAELNRVANNSDILDNSQEGIYPVMRGHSHSSSSGNDSDEGSGGSLTGGGVCFSQSQNTDRSKSGGEGNGANRANNGSASVVSTTSQVAQMSSLSALSPSNEEKITGNVPVPNTSTILAHSHNLPLGALSVTEGPNFGPRNENLPYGLFFHASTNTAELQYSSAIMNGAVENSDGMGGFTLRHSTSIMDFLAEASIDTGMNENESEFNSNPNPKRIPKGDQAGLGIAFGGSTGAHSLSQSSQIQRTSEPRTLSSVQASISVRASLSNNHCVTDDDNDDNDNDIDDDWAIGNGTGTGTGTNSPTSSSVSVSESTNLNGNANNSHRSSDFAFTVASFTAAAAGTAASTTASSTAAITAALAATEKNRKAAQAQTGHVQGQGLTGQGSASAGAAAALSGVQASSTSSASTSTASQGHLQGNRSTPTPTAQAGAQSRSPVPTRTRGARTRTRTKKGQNEY